jgi:hypothetical protein
MTDSPHPIVAPRLTALDGIRHGFFTRHGGVSTGIYGSLNCGLGSQDDTARVTENRARVARHLGAASHSIVTAHQYHSRDVAIAATVWDRAEMPRADAIVTATPGLVVGVLAADCAPVLFADAHARVIGAAHAGWRGALDGILEQTVAAMVGLGARSDRIHAALGPCIGPASYEVGPEFEARFVEADAANARYFSRPEEPSGRPHFDLPRFVVDRLGRLDLASVENVTRCTLANESLLFSYRGSQRRKHPDYGRQISAIVLP